MNNPVNLSLRLLMCCWRNKITCSVMKEAHAELIVLQISYGMLTKLKSGENLSRHDCYVTFHSKMPGRVLEFFLDNHRGEKFVWNKLLELIGVARRRFAEIDGWKTAVHYSVVAYLLCHGDFGPNATPAAVFVDMKSIVPFCMVAS